MGINFSAFICFGFNELDTSSTQMIEKAHILGINTAKYDNLEPDDFPMEFQPLFSEIFDKLNEIYNLPENLQLSYTYGGDAWSGETYMFFGLCGSIAREDTVQNIRDVCTYTIQDFLLINSILTKEFDKQLKLYYGPCID